MSTVTKKNARRLPDPTFDGVPYGNVAMLEFEMQTNSSGVMTDSDKETAVAVGDKVILGVLNGGMRLSDALAIIPAAFTALTTAKLGYEYVDGVDDADVPQDDDYFFSALDTASAGRTRMGNDGVVPVTLPKDAYLVLTVGGADHASAGHLVVDVLAAMVGRP